jgi:Rieske Fe-S protein
VPLPFRTHGAIRFEDQGRFHPRKLLLPLAAQMAAGGVAIFERSRVVAVADGTPCEVRTQTGRLHATRVVVVTDSIIQNRVLLQTKLAPYRTYALAAAYPQELPGLFYDTAEPYHYIRTHPGPNGPWLIVGGEDHRVGEGTDTHQRYQRLERFTRRRFVAGEVGYRWSGQVAEPVDGLPYIGQNPLSKHVFLATGFSGNGMVNATLASDLLTQLATGERHRAAELFDPRRITPLASAKSFVEENVDFPAHLLLDRLPTLRRSVDQVPRGEGRIVSVSGRKLAVYRSDEGQVRALSPVCTHMGCHVHWNTEARSWDCPCHGSRFSPDGEVLHGPAVRALKPVELEEERAAEQEGAPDSP